MNHNNSPKISVITPSYNSSEYLEQAIQSVFDQNYANFEHIIVDGASTDGTLEILKRFPHLKWISEPDDGQSDAMNKGFAMSSGEIIVYLNSDDYFLPDAFNTVVPYFSKGAKFIVGKVKVIMEDGSFYINDPKVEFTEMLKWWQPNAFSQNPVGYFYLREVQEAVDGFNVSNHFSMDVEFLLEAAKKYDFTKIPDILGVYRCIPGTKTYGTSGAEDLRKKLEFADRYLIDLGKNYVEHYEKEKKHFLAVQKRYEGEQVYINELKRHFKSKSFASFAFTCITLLFKKPVLLPKRLGRKIKRLFTEGSD